MASQILEGELVERETDAGGLAAINASEINQQIATAKRYPRSIKEFVREATEMATLSEAVAMECMYSLKRTGEDGSVKVIEGPTARMAEIVASAWGNCRAGARVISEDDRFVTAQGAFMDLQRNVAITYEVKRRITTKKGKKFGDDMIGVTANAACSIALRNAVFKGVPKAFWQSIFEKARQCAIGDVKSLAKRRGDMLAAFGKMGVSAAEVFAYLGVPGEADVTLDHLALLIGVYQAIKDGDTDIDQTFRSSTTEAGAKVAESKMAAKFGKGKQADASDAKPAEEQKPAEEAAEDQALSGEPADDTLLQWEAYVAEAADLPQLDRVADAVDAANLSDEQKNVAFGWIAERRKSLAKRK